MSVSKLEEILVAYVLGPEAASQHALGKIGKRFLGPVADAIARLSVGFTSGRDTLPANYWRGAERDAYLLYYLPVNFAKAGALLAELAAHPTVFHPESLRGKPFRILDVGCGPGTATLATLFFLAGLNVGEPLSIECFLTDRSAAAVRDAEALVRRAAALLNRDGERIRVTVATAAADLSGVRGGSPVSLIWIGNVLNEVGADATDWLAELVARRLADDGSLIVFEPALRDVTRALMRTRDGVLERVSGVNVFSPCTADGACRMLRDGSERDWCHSDIRWSPPDLVAQLDALTGLRKTSLKFSYVIFRRDGKRLHDVFPAGNGTVWRIVGDRLKEKGRERVAACGPERFAMLTRLKRDRSDANRALDRIARGQLVRIDDRTAAPTTDAPIGAETAVSAEGPFLASS